ncbi:hypothetical protein PVK06_017351 [Gossypium arboreum]|uniref:Uncharacterized protein n=1 Tax=Gossypium arboreum TaxID=29729 RepID=A0ABR0Q3D9_GOSAR|nr:hypothetical protein PVK06_017351 [Gossypium arboreum]
MGHSIDNCTAFKKLIERFIKMGIVRLDDHSGPNVVGNLLPSHSNQGVNVIIESGGKMTKIDVTEECTEFRALVQSLMDNKELEFFEDVKGFEGKDVYDSKEGSTEKVYKVNHLVVIISRPRNNEAGTQAMLRVIT